MNNTESPKFFYESKTKINRISSTTSKIISNIMSSTTSTTFRPIIKPNPESIPQTVQVPNWNEEACKTIINHLGDLKIWIAIIALCVMFVIILKLVKACSTAYKRHNEIVIKNHNKISPQL